jgi:hypothetical protein
MNFEQQLQEAIEILLAFDEEVMLSEATADPGPLAPHLGDQLSPEALTELNTKIHDVMQQTLTRRATRGMGTKLDPETMKMILSTGMIKAGVDKNQANELADNKEIQDAFVNRMGGPQREKIKQDEPEKRSTLERVAAKTGQPATAQTQQASAKGAGQQGGFTGFRPTF